MNIINSFSKKIRIFCHNIYSYKKKISRYDKNSWKSVKLTSSSVLKKTLKSYKQFIKTYQSQPITTNRYPPPNKVVTSDTHPTPLTLRKPLGTQLKIQNTPRLKKIRLYRLNKNHIVVWNRPCPERLWRFKYRRTDLASRLHRSHNHNHIHWTLKTASFQLSGVWVRFGSRMACGRLFLLSVLSGRYV